jgi:hypothetical protein
MKRRACATCTTRAGSFRLPGAAAPRGRCPAVIEKADPRLRAVVMPAITAIVAIGLVLAASADTWRSAVIDWVLRDPAQSRSRAVAVSIALAAAVLVPVVAMAAYLWRFSARVMRDRRFPPRGTRLIVDMIVQEVKRRCGAAGCCSSWRSAWARPVWYSRSCSGA